MKSTKTFLIAIVLMGIIAITSIYAEYVINRPMKVYLQIICTIGWGFSVYLVFKFLGKQTEEVIDDFVIMDKPLSEVDSEPEFEISTEPIDAKPKPKKKYKPRPKKKPESGETGKPKTATKKSANKKPAGEETVSPKKPRAPRKPRKPNTEDNN